jgi:hypothetical protein
MHLPGSHSLEPLPGASAKRYHLEHCRSCRRPEPKLWGKQRFQRREAVDDAMVAKGIYQYLVTIAAALGC